MEKSKLGVDRMKYEPMKTLLKVLLTVLCGCTVAQVNVDVVSERTALENQILGTYNALDNDMLLVASVRGVDARGRIRTPARHSREQEDAIAALQIQAFHADDLQTFKQLGWIGENNEGLLTAFPLDTETAPAQLKEFAQRFTPAEFNATVSQVNQSREIIMRRLIDLNENLSEDNYPEIRRLFGKINVESALPGEKVQNEDGKWTIKK
jgi:uncharacterized protein YdbL (DUF1318 family)